MKRADCYKNDGQFLVSMGCKLGLDLVDRKIKARPVTLITGQAVGSLERNDP